MMLLPPGASVSRRRTRGRLMVLTLPGADQILHMAGRRVRAAESIPAPASMIAAQKTESAWRTLITATGLLPS